MACCLLAAIGLAGCREKAENPNKDIGAEAFSGWKTQAYALNSLRIRDAIDGFCRADRDSMAADYYTRSYYSRRSPFLWIDRSGVDERADTLVAVLKTVGSMGFSEAAFGVERIESDLRRVRCLDFGGDSLAINRMMASIEYRLTKAYLRYTVGQRFGFADPYRLFNRLDPLPCDSTERPKGFRKLYDAGTERPGNGFYAKALRQIRSDSLGLFLRSVSPADPLYARLMAELPSAKGLPARRRLLCNMERCRWRGGNPVAQDGKYVVVNIPAFHLYAYGGDSVMEMRVGCGSVKTKTPMLNSAIERMDVNPVWNIPVSIVKGEVARHAGDTLYFNRNKYYIVERKSGKRLPAESVTPAMLRSGNYRVSQEGGEGNSLGRIIFRFPNNFSVFLHDTSSRGVFQRDYRGVSHGCIRVERPFDFAAYLLDSPGEWTLDKLRISMDLPPQTARGRAYVKAGHEDNRLVSSLKVSPGVPIYITYFTLYPDCRGRLAAWPDVYGYDEALWRWIKPFTD